MEFQMGELPNLPSFEPPTTKRYYCAEIREIIRVKPYEEKYETAINVAFCYLLYNTETGEYRSHPDFIPLAHNSTKFLKLLYALSGRVIRKINPGKIEMDRFIGLQFSVRFVTDSRGKFFIGDRAYRSPEKHVVMDLSKYETPPSALNRKFEVGETFEGDISQLFDGPVPDVGPIDNQPTPSTPSTPKKIEEPASPVSTDDASPIVEQLLHAEIVKESSALDVEDLDISL